MVTFSDKPISRIWNTRLVQDGYQIQIEAAATFLVIFEAHMINLLIIKVKILVLIKWSYRSSPSNYGDNWT